MRSMVDFEINGTTERTTNVTSNPMLRGADSNQRMMLVFTGAMVLLNLIQSAFTDLTGDEALYWMHGQFPDWGYKDHPPVVGLMMALGSAVFPGTMGARFVIVLANGVTLYMLWLLAGPKRTGPFILLIASLPVLHIYGFIATPDVPLLLATAAYLWVWKAFLNQQDTRVMWWLGVWMAALVWSKYYGVLIILFTWLPHMRLWFNRTFWIAACVGIGLFTPHIVWQIVQDLPTVKFHLVERSGEFRWSNVSDYVLGQFGVFNPMVLIASFILLFRTRPADAFERSLHALAWLMWLFFLTMSARGRVEAHWTAACTFPVVILLSRYRWNWLEGRLFTVCSSIILLLIAFGRLALMVDIFPPFYRAFHRPEEKLKLIHDVAGDLPVCFMNSYQDPSLYMFYFDKPAHSVQNADGGRNQYDWWRFNEYVHKKDFLFVASYEAPGFEKVERNGITLHVRRFSDLPFLHDLDLRPEPWKHEVRQGDTLTVSFRVINGNRYGLNFEDSTHTVSWKFLMSYKKITQQVRDVQWLDWPHQLAPGEVTTASLRVVMDVPPGSYRCGVSARLDALPQTYQSQWIRVIVHPREMPD
jgi:hypothetical protein